MTSITLQENRWHVMGDILMDNANAVLSESRALAMPGDLCIDLSAVTSVDTAALSLVMEWQRRAIASNSQVTFAHLPESLVSLASLYGVTDFISLNTH
jgi:phospholipid transport system transporter-binding protein